MNLKIGQVWISDTHPHESFEIYDGVVDTCVDAFTDESMPFNDQPETCKIFFWKRYSPEAFEKFLDDKLGEKRESSYPYMWYGESKKQTLANKIKKYRMKLEENAASFK